MIRIASAPGRCGILGNPSDIYGGAVLSCSLPLRAWCRISDAPQEELPEDPTLWRAAQPYLRDAQTEDKGHSQRVEWRTDVPRSSGLAGSTALLTATMLAGDAPFSDGLPTDALRLAWNVREAEIRGAGVACGWQDAAMAVLGGLQLLRFRGFTPDRIAPEWENATPPIATPLDANLPFLLITTGVERLSGSVHGPMIERWKRGDPEVSSAVKRLSTLGEPGAEALVSGDYGRLATLMTQNHTIVRDLGGSGDAIDRLVERALAHGALAAKLAGAGMGGTVIALTERPENLQAELKADGYSRFVRPEIAPGARRESEAAWALDTL